MACGPASDVFEAKNRLGGVTSPPVIWSLYVCCKPQFWLAGSFAFGRLVIVLVLPICLEQLLRFLSGNEPALLGLLHATTYVA